VNEALRQAFEMQAMFLAYGPQKNKRQDILGEPIVPNWAKTPKTIGVLELWGSRPLPGQLPYRREAENDDRCRERDERPRDTQEPARRLE
jgi:hypothetical protein